MYLYTVPELLLKIPNVKLFFFLWWMWTHVDKPKHYNRFIDIEVVYFLQLFSDNHAMCLRSTKLLEYFHLNEKGLNYLP